MLGFLAITAETFNSHNKKNNNNILKNKINNNIMNNNYTTLCLYHKRKIQKCFEHIKPWKVSSDTQLESA